MADAFISSRDAGYLLEGMLEVLLLRAGLVGHLHRHVEGGRSHGEVGLNLVACLLDRRLHYESEGGHGGVGFLEVLLATNGDQIIFWILVEKLEVFGKSSAERLDCLLVQRGVVGGLLEFLGLVLVDNLDL